MIGQWAVEMVQGSMIDDLDDSRMKSELKG